ncbi:MAG: 3-oxoacyl-ACP reductase, partial [Crocinitomicaceae bacterium]|nr:3-oxoacyl-ACP reductase [Crocinitomicaceae bacterium]
MKKLVLVSGSSRGLGASIARTFIENDYEVAINYFNSEEKALELVKELGSSTRAYKADVSNLEEVKSMIG